jgi:hypothetical protein
MAMIERRVVDVEKPLKIEEIRGELSLRYERMNMKSSRNKEGESFEENAIFSGHFKIKCRNCGQIRHKSFQCKNQGSHNGGNNGNSSGGNFCSYCCKPGHDKKDCFKLKKKDSRSNNGSTNNGHADRPNFDSQDVVLWEIYPSGPWYHFVRENLDDGIIKNEFTKSVENQSDIFTKNVTQEIYERHVEKFLEEYIEGEFNG